MTRGPYVTAEEIEKLERDPNARVDWRYDVLAPLPLGDSGPLLVELRRHFIGDVVELAGFPSWGVLATIRVEGSYPVRNFVQLRARAMRKRWELLESVAAGLAYTNYAYAVKRFVAVVTDSEAEVNELQSAWLLDVGYDGEPRAAPPGWFGALGVLLPAMRQLRVLGELTFP